MGSVSESGLNSLLAPRHIVAFKEKVTAGERPKPQAQAFKLESISWVEYIRGEGIAKSLSGSICWLNMFGETTF